MRVRGFCHRGKIVRGIFDRRPLFSRKDRLALNRSKSIGYARCEGVGVTVIVRHVTKGLAVEVPRARVEVSHPMLCANRVRRNDRL